MMYWYCHRTVIGPISITATSTGITRLDFSDGPVTDGAANEEASLIREAFSQVESYLAGNLKKFDLPLEMHGTDFQKEVWNALLSIPYGSTASYKDVALMIGNIKAVRAVGMANNRNPIAIIVPCHRVIGSDGSLVGYAGGMERKRILLELESPQGKLF